MSAIYRRIDRTRDGLYSLYKADIFTMIRLTLFFLLVPLLNQTALAQERCGTEVAEQYRRNQHPSVPDVAAFERWMHRQLMQEKASGTALRRGEVQEDPLVIPVVVHVIHNGEPVGQGVNISDEQVLSQVAVLNEDFRRENLDASQTHPAFVAIAGSMNVVFKLAQRTPGGEPTTGIVRRKGTKTAYTIFERNLLSSISYWPAEDYMNVWVTNLSADYLGVGQYPDINLPGLDDQDKGTRLTDGVLIDYQVFGSISKDPSANLRSIYDLGRTTTHEVGHFLGLRHVWGDGGCSVDDFVEDTPVSSRNYNAECPSSVSSCGTLDMTENYLYYTADACMNAFTEGQVARMQIVLENAPRRLSLTSSPGALPPNVPYYDLAITQLRDFSFVTCERLQQPALLVENKGTITAEDFMINYQLSGMAPVSLVYDGPPLQSLESRWIALPAFTLAEGEYSFEAELELPANAVDINLTNDYLFSHFVIDDSRDFIPYRESFAVPDLAAAGWSTLNPDGATTWQIEPVAGAASGEQAAFIPYFGDINLGEADWLVSPVLDFSTAAAASMQFRLSYGQRNNFDDRLFIYASSDCGSTFDDVLASYTAADMASDLSGSYWQPGSVSDWKEITVDLSAYASEPDTRFAFVAVSGGGNNIYLDDIEFFTESAGQIVDVARGGMVIYPNPTRGAFKVTVNAPSRQRGVLQVYDQLGQLLIEHPLEYLLNQTFNLDLSINAPGLYMVRVQGERFLHSGKVLVR
jgi:hypothetical protein